MKGVADRGMAQRSPQSRQPIPHHRCTADRPPGRSVTKGTRPATAGGSPAPDRPRGRARAPRTPRASGAGPPGPETPGSFRVRACGARQRECDRPVVGDAAEGAPLHRQDVHPGGPGHGPHRQRPVGRRVRAREERVVDAAALAGVEGPEEFGGGDLPQRRGGDGPVVVVRHDVGQPPAALVEGQRPDDAGVQAVRAAVVQCGPALDVEVPRHDGRGRGRGEGPAHVRAQGPDLAPAQGHAPVPLRRLDVRVEQVDLHAGEGDAAACGGRSRGVLNGKKKSVPVPVFPTKPAGTPCAQPWLVAVGGWRLAAVGGWQLATGGWWRLVVVAGGWWLAVGGWRRLAVVGSWRLVAAGGWGRLVAGGWWRLVVGGWWRLAVDGSYRLAVGGPLGRSFKGCP